MTIWQALLNLIFPPRCPFCGEILAPDRGPVTGSIPWNQDKVSLEGVLCSRCAATLPWLTYCCPRCAYPLPQPGNAYSCPFCSAGPPAFAHLCALGRFEGALRETLHRFKYRGEKALAVPLGKLLAARLSAMSWLPPVEMIVPVPLYSSRRRTRGYNQSALLAETIGRELGIPRRELLERTRDTQSQTGLNRRDRRANMQGAFRCREVEEGCRPRGKYLLLIDDILTSGATVQAAALALNEAGAARVSAAVIARQTLAGRR